MRHQRFSNKGVRGFGLMQRERRPAAYQDIFNLYHLVPSAWIEPRGSWGEGDVHLVELSTGYEGLDNVVAFWSPRQLPKPMQPYRFAYTLYWTSETDLKLNPGLASVTATRIGRDSRNEKRRQVVIDFDGGRLAGLDEKNPPVPIASCSGNATITEVQPFTNSIDGGWRVIMKFEPTPGDPNPVDIRCTLKQGEEVLSETWTYHWSPP
jgi:periplasmic glucans biosynthesis protein